MSQTTAIKLTDRAVIRLEGPEKEALLQGVITNNIHKLDEGAPLYAALLTPQGKYLFDFILFKKANAILMDCEANRVGDLLRRLMMYKLRADVTITDMSSDYAVWAVLGGQEGDDDPRHAEIGKRLIVPVGEEPTGQSGTLADYESHLARLGIPNASHDLEVDKRPILEANLEELNGVDFTKGCYVGQEVTARMKHRGAVRKRLFPMRFSGNAPAVGGNIMAGDKKAGVIVSIHGQTAFGMIKLDYLAADLACGDTALELVIPDYLSDAITALDGKGA